MILCIEQYFHSMFHNMIAMAVYRSIAWMSQHSLTNPLMPDICKYEQRSPQHLPH